MYVIPIPGESFQKGRLTLLIKGESLSTTNTSIKTSSRSLPTNQARSRLPRSLPLLSPASDHRILFSFLVSTGPSPVFLPLSKPRSSGPFFKFEPWRRSELFFSFSTLVIEFWACCFGPFSFHWPCGVDLVHSFGFYHPAHYS